MGRRAGHQRHRHPRWRWARSAKCAAISTSTKCRIELHRRADLPAGWPLPGYWIFPPRAASYRDAQRLIMQAVRHIEHRWVRSAIAVVTGRCACTPTPVAGQCAGAAAGVSRRSAGRRQSAGDAGVPAPAAFGSVEFAQLFPICCDSLPAHRRRWPAITALLIPARGAAAARVSALRSVSPPAEGMTNSIRRALRILNTGLSLCVTGETGCGKEHFSRRLFQESRWRNGSFVAINCAALPEPLIESELFGYAPGAPAPTRKAISARSAGRTAACCSSMKSATCRRACRRALLRVLQEKRSRRSAAAALIRSISRWSAPHHDLPRQVQAGAFREDLLYRIQEYSLRIPPLRERAQLEAFILQLWRELGGERRDIRLLPEALAMLARYPARQHAAAVEYAQGVAGAGGRSCGAHHGRSAAVHRGAGAAPGRYRHGGAAGGDRQGGR